MIAYYDKSTDVSFDFNENELIKKLICATMEAMGCPYEVCVSVSVVGEDEIHELNLEHRGIDSGTDVLSFPMNEFDEEGIFNDEMEFDPDTDELMLGDVVLCADRVKQQAKEYGHSELREYAFLIVHSLLHLSGFDHEDDDERLRMEKRQSEILDGLGITR